MARVRVNARDVWKRFRRNRLAVAGLVYMAILITLAVLAPLVAPYDPLEPDFAASLQPPSRVHWLGTDEHGRDVLSRIIFGARLSLLVGVISVGISLLAGLAIGAVAGFYGGWVDDFLMRIMDIMLAFPGVLLALAIMMTLGPGLEKAMVAIGIVGIPQYARLVRGSILAVREKEFVEAARAAGLSDTRVIIRHVLPNIVAPVIVRSTLGTSEAILEAAALGFLGLGARLPTPEWGAMLSRGRQYLYQAPHLVTFPGLAISATVLALNVVGDGLRDALDPRLKT